MDTDIIINFLKNEKKAVKLITSLIEKGEPLATTSVNEFELWKGVFKSKSKHTEESVKNFLDRTNIFDLDSKASKKAAEIYELLSSKGNIVDALDVMIASIAIVNNEHILTENRKHFERIPGIKLSL